MAQPKLELISKAIAKKAGDEVSAIGTNGELFSAEQRLQAINDARGALYFDILNQIGIEQFINTYKTFIKITPSDTPIVLLGEDDFIGTLPSNCRQLIGVELIDDTDNKVYEAKAIPPSGYVEFKTNEYSPFKADAKNVKFMEFNNTFRVFGLPNDSYRAFLVYLENIIPATIGGNDISDPDEWRQKTIDLAYLQLLTDVQRRQQ